MIAAWMMYIVAISCVLGLAALTLEYGLNMAGRPTRWIWAAGITGTVIFPIVAVLTPNTLEPTGVMPADAAMPVMFEASRFSLVETLTTLDVLSFPLIVLWSLTSVVVLTTLCASTWRIRRQALQWTPGQVAGVPVLYSASAGPAVVGCFPGTIVLPRWSRALQDDWQSMMVAHEQEHLRAQDTGLIVCALVVAALIPWNPLAWWMFRRLKHAVELDCDRRVLRQGINRKAYGNLLIELTHRARRGPIPAAAFAAPKPLIIRRIRLMMQPSLRGSRLYAAGAVFAAATFLVIGCEMPTPPDPTAAGELTAVESETVKRKVDVVRLKLLEAERALAVEVENGADQARINALVELIADTRSALEATMSRSTLHLRGELRFRPHLDAPLKRIIEENRFGRFTPKESAEATRIEGTSRVEPWVYIDGVRVDDDTGTGEYRVALHELDPDTIERIEVVKGEAASARFGPAASGGVIRVTTKTPGNNER